MKRKKEGSLRSKRPRTRRTKFWPRVLVFCILDERKMGQEQKGEKNGVGEGKEGKSSLLSPPPPPSFHFFALTPFFLRPECEISFPSYGNACYAGYKQGDLPRYDEIARYKALDNSLADQR